MLVRMWRKMSTPPLLVGLQDCTTTLIPVGSFFGKLDIALPEDTAISLLGIYPEYAPMFNKDACSTMFIAAVFIITSS